MSADKPQEATFQLGEEMVRVREADLEAIRREALRFLQESKEPQRDQYLAELRDAECDIDEEGVARLDAWLLEERNQVLTLVRHPPRTKVMRFALISFQRDKAGWRATSLSHERVTAR